MRLLTDAEMEEVMRSSAWKLEKGKCPTCSGTGAYRWQGENHECSKDEYGVVCYQLALWKHYCLAHIPKEHAQLVWDEFPQAEQLRKDITRYIQTFEFQRKMGLGWTFAGRHGIGKTWAAVHIAKEVVKLGYPAYFINFFDLKNLFERPEEERRPIQRHVEGSALLVIDDILKPMGERQGAFYQEQMESVLRARSVSHQPTIVTTNLREDEFDSYYPRVFSVLGGKQLYVEFEDTGDHRRELAKIARKRMEAAMNEEVAPLL